MTLSDLRHFGQIIQQTSDAIFSTDDSLIVKTWNTAAEKLYGFTALEAIGKSLNVLLEMILTEEQRKAQMDDLQRNGFYEGEYEIYNKSREKLYVLASVTVLREENNDISGYVTIHRNISERRKAEESLKTSNIDLKDKVKEKNSQLENIFERITDAFVALDDQWRYTYINKKASEIFGEDRSTMLGKYIWTVFPEETGPDFYKAYRHAMLNQEFVYLEAYYAPYKRWIENFVYPSPEGLSIFFRDTTAHKLIEEDAKLTNQRLLLHLTNSPLAVIEWDTNLIITSWSQQAETIFGWTSAEVTGRSVAEIKMVFEGDLPEVGDVLSDLLSGKINSAKVVNRNNTKTGKVIVCEWYNSVLKDDYGNVTSCMSLVQDITEKEKAEERLAISEQELNLIYNSGTDILFLLSVEQNKRYKFININNAFKNATGLSDEMVLNKYVDEVIPEPSLQIVLKNYRKAIKTKKTLQWEEVTEYPTGTKTGLVTVTPIFDEKGNCVRLVGSVHDITENKRAEVELKEKNAQLRSLSAHLHEVREEERANIAREIHDELGERLTGIRLDISWIESQLTAGSLPVSEKFPGLIQLVDDTIKTVRKISTELRPSILDDFGLEDAIEWQASEFEKRTGINCKVKSFMKSNINNKKIDITLFRIFQESLTNIVRHSKAKNVSAELLEQKNNIELIITDDGVGMDLEAVKSKRTLGLIGMKERISMVNGEYNVTSEIGKGTTVSVSVPKV